MKGLISVQEYVKKTAIIIATVLDMEVLVCDVDLKILGDSCKAKIDPKDIEYLSVDSILTKSMSANEVMILKDTKKQFMGCRYCDKSETCPTESIIAFPILHGHSVIGGIGIYANEDKQRNKLIAQNNFFIDFITKMSELIINKLEENEEKLDLKEFQKRLSSIIESIDVALIGIDQNNKIIHFNTKLKRLFDFESSIVNNLKDIYNHISNKDFIKFIETSDKFKEKEFQFKIKNKLTNIMVTFDPIEIDGINKGALIYFKKVSEIYAHVNKVSNNFSAITFDDVIGISDLIIKLKEDAINFAKSSSTMLIHGESGTGKDIFARAIHSASNFCNGPFITINCASIPDNLIESELFGHEEGSFTGSMKGGRVGKFELADMGTLFLDEIGEIPIHLQSKLLRAIQDRKIQKIGSNKDIPIKIRIIAATNRNLEKMIQTGEFREDLFYRISVIPITVPPLRERKKDIPVLLKYFLDFYSSMLFKNIENFSIDSEDMLCKYTWPGNVRELQNVVEYATNKSQGKYIDLKDLPEKILYQSKVYNNVEIKPLKEIEDFYIKEALKVCGYDLEGKEKAAKMLGISRATLYRKLKL